MESADQVSRRRFFRVVAGEFIALFEELRGRPQLRLSELCNFPKHALMRIKPMLLPGAQVAVSKQQITTRYGQVKRIVAIEHSDPAIKFVIDQMYDGQKTVGEITSELAATMFWDEELSFDCVRDLLLKLVNAGVCVPSNYVDV